MFANKARLRQTQTCRGRERSRLLRQHEAMSANMGRPRLNGREVKSLEKALAAVQQVKGRHQVFSSCGHYVASLIVEVLPCSNHSRARPACQCDDRRRTERSASSTSFPPPAHKILARAGSKTLSIRDYPCTTKRASSPRAESGPIQAVKRPGSTMYSSAGV